jgi:hypothetical protein
MMDKIPFEEWALKSIDPPHIHNKILPSESRNHKNGTELKEAQKTSQVVST